MATETARAIEAILMVAEGPVDPQLLSQLLEVEQTEIEATLQELMASYEVEDRGFILTKVAGGYRYQSHPDQAPYVERFVLEGQTARLSAAALETLAIVAYKQPISRAQIAAIRGVSVDGVIRTLEQRGYITEIARDPGPGNPSLFGTTDVFLEKLGLDTVDDLPPIAAFVPGPDIVEQLEQGLRAEIDPQVVADIERAVSDGEDGEDGEDGVADIDDVIADIEGADAGAVDMGATPTNDEPGDQGDEGDEGDEGEPDDGDPVEDAFEELGETGPEVAVSEPDALEETDAPEETNAPDTTDATEPTGEPVGPTGPPADGGRGDAVVGDADPEP